MLTPTLDKNVPSIIRTLNTCIETCIDGEKGYATAAADVRDLTLKALFEQYAMQRAAFVLALQEAIEELGGMPENQGTAKGTLHRGLTGARLALEGRSDAVILDECERGDRAAVAAYDRALARTPLPTLPPKVSQLLVEQRAAIKGTYDEVMHEDIRRRSARG
jgi:uncharacterized protein (TIGR02284 family)